MSRMKSCRSPCRDQQLNPSQKEPCDARLHELRYHKLTFEQCQRYRVVVHFELQLHKVSRALQTTCYFFVQILECSHLHQGWRMGPVLFEHEPQRTIEAHQIQRASFVLVEVCCRVNELFVQKWKKTKIVHKGFSLTHIKKSQKQNLFLRQAQNPTFFEQQKGVQNIVPLF